MRSQVTSSSDGARHFSLYRWDFELSRSPSAVLVAIEWSLGGAVVFTVFPMADVGFDYLGSTAHLQLLALACVGGPLAWAIHRIRGLPHWNWIDFGPDRIRFRRYLESDIPRQEIKGLATYLPQYRLPYLVYLFGFASPTPFSTRWAIPPSGGYVVTFARRKLGYVGGWFWWHRRIYFAPRDREGFHERLEGWWGSRVP